MKQTCYTIVAITALCFVFLFLTASQLIPVHAEKTIVAADDRAFLYRKVHGHLEPVGRLDKQQPVYAIKVHPNWYIIQIGSDNYYIYKQHIKEIDTSLFANNVPHPKPIKTVYPQTNIWVYKQRSFHTPIGAIYKHVPVQVIQIEGHWYKIEFAGHPAYIHERHVAGLATEVPIIVYHHILKEKENRKYHKPTVVKYEEFIKQ